MSYAKIAAKLTIFRAAGMTPEGKQEIAEWLRLQAGALVETGDEYAEQYDASYRVPAEEGDPDAENEELDLESDQEAGAAAPGPGSTARSEDPGGEDRGSSQGQRQNSSAG